MLIDLRLPNYSNNYYYRPDIHTDKWKRIGSLEINLQIYDPVIFSKELKVYEWRNNILSTNSMSLNILKQKNICIRKKNLNCTQILTRNGSQTWM